jgi:SWI/SNF-related matrix-associated actin-dependent regulator of chromatin subfamily A-like protein 1
MSAHFGNTDSAHERRRSFPTTIGLFQFSKLDSLSSVARILAVAYRAVPVSVSAAVYLSASLEDGEAVLRFPYDERLRLLLRAIPGRRWDPVDRVWRLPLDPDRAEALARLLEEVPGESQISPALARAIERRRGRRHPRECLLDLARPDGDWWLGFATDAAPELVEALLEHPEARSLPAIGRGLIPFDDHAAWLVQTLAEQTGRLHLSEAAERQLALHRARREREHAGRDVAGLPGRGAAGLHPDYGESNGEHAARQHEREDADWLARPARWHGTVEVEGPSHEPVFLLLGDPIRLPPGLREQAAGAPGGATVPLTLDSWQAIDGQLAGWISHAARRCVKALQEGHPAPPAVLELSTVHADPTFVLAPGHDPEQLDAFAALAGALPPKPRRGAQHEHTRLPAIRADPFCVPELDAFLAAHDVWVASEALALLQDVRQQHARAAGLVALSAATDAALEVPGLGGQLKPFQRAGVSYLLAQRRAFLADEQGLGKTIEAIATLEADGAYPAVVVCPASLKLNWLRELERWLPQRSAQALVGTGARAGAALPASGLALAPPDAALPASGLALAPPDAALPASGLALAPADAALDSASPATATGPTADITVVNYDILAPRLDQLRALQPRALVLDESHYCKNAAAKRTQAVQRLAAAVPPEGLVLALTGTPVMNRPKELISQLRILGRLADFGSGAQFGKRFHGPDAHLRLHWHLRARCFARRLKHDVLPQLPAKTRAVVPVELDNQSDYRLAERDIVAWLQTQPFDLRELDAKVAAALRAERLVRLNALKLLAARGKLAAALGWVHDFLTSGERLVVFAHHREIQRAVLERFPTALHILGADSHGARDASLRAFQGPDDSHNQLIVCSIEVAGQGITLTRASNVAFLELDWTPAKHDQAEDRLHRIGQLDAVNVTYLLAAATIDETIATLLERKRAVIGAVTDGRPEDDEGVIDALVRELRAGTPYRRLRAVA